MPTQPPRDNTTQPRPTRQQPSLAPYPPPATRSAPPTRDASADSMTKTERLYLAAVLNGQARFEPVTFRLLGGSRYTPDFLSVDDGVLTFHEVKGSYRLESEGRAWTAFNEAAALFPYFRWIWAVRNNSKTSTTPFTVKVRIDPEPISATATAPAPTAPAAPTNTTPQKGA